MLSTRHRRQALASRQCLSCGIVKVFFLFLSIVQ
nr:MAG TPA: hypothetical protein [Caudoviricetes sp.]